MDKTNPHVLSIDALALVSAHFSDKMTPEMRETVQKAMSANRNAMARNEREALYAGLPPEERPCPKQAAYMEQRKARRAVIHYREEDRER